MLKPSGTKHLNLKCDKQLLKVAFNFNLRRYIEDVPPSQAADLASLGVTIRGVRVRCVPENVIEDVKAQFKRSLTARRSNSKGGGEHGEGDLVGRCRLTLSNPC
jgi:hypothetical protein